MAPLTSTRVIAAIGVIGAIELSGAAKALLPVGSPSANTRIADTSSVSPAARVMKPATVLRRADRFFFIAETRRAAQGAIV